MSLQSLQQALGKFAQAPAGHLPTPLEHCPNLSHALNLSIWVKRDDCTGLGFGGNKVRQLIFYVGEALAQNADTLPITGAVQSNFVCTAAAFASKFNLQCHIQLEERVSPTSELYRRNGNVMLSKLLGATLHSFPKAENEAAADAAVYALAEQLRKDGHRPYVIPLGVNSPPLGALGYVQAAIELTTQLQQVDTNVDGQVDEILIASGSALTHTGLLYGLRALSQATSVRGVCVRRDATQQTRRVRQRLDDIEALLQQDITWQDNDINLYDSSLAPGYGQLNSDTEQAIRQAAQSEGLFLDPVYTGKTMAALMQLAKSGQLQGKRVLFWHTGGQSALHAYEDQLIPGGA